MFGIEGVVVGLRPGRGGCASAPIHAIDGAVAAPEVSAMRIGREPALPRIGPRPAGPVCGP